VLVATGAGAQRTPPAVIDAHPLTHVHNGEVQGCGVRLTVGEPGTPASSWFDVSFNVFRRGLGMAQSFAYEIRRSDLQGDSRPARVPVRSAWVRGAEGSARRGENSERKDALIYMLDTDEVLGLFETVAAGEPLTLGIKRWDQRTDAVYTGTPMLTLDSRREISSCLARLAE
jgi:hypothetical protein